MAAESIALSIDDGHVRSVREYQVRSLEVLLAQATNDEGKQIVFSSVPAEAILNRPNCAAFFITPRDGRHTGYGSQQWGGRSAYARPSGQRWPDQTCFGLVSSFDEDPTRRSGGQELAGHIDGRSPGRHCAG